MRLTLLARSYCHLCDEMLAALGRLSGVPPVDVFDVDAPAELPATTWTDIPGAIDRRTVIMALKPSTPAKVRPAMSSTSDVAS